MSNQPAISGFFETPTQTPTGAPKKIAVDNCYVSKDEFISTVEGIGSGIDASHILYTSGELTRIAIRASAQVSRMCGRYFDTQTIDETETRFTVRPLNPQLVTITLLNSPYSAINSIYLQVLRFFIQIDITSSQSNFQPFPEFGYYKFVPLLSSAGQGAGVPLPAEIIDRLPLGVIWTNYTFGFGTQQTNITLTGKADGVNTMFQTAIGNKLWAPDQTINIYDNGTLVPSTNYTLSCPDGQVTFNSAPVSGHIITADFTTNDSIAYDIKEATILLMSDIINRGLQNPMGYQSLNLTAFSVSYGNSVMERVKYILRPYTRNRLKLIS